ncbi:MAG TPA: hypothetical protein VGR22_05535 [Thermomicrobiales bacterium]|nr:hypothetical protein [Thermomicrobiales bacterium]
MARKRHTGAFVAGSLLGGLAAAALTLWKTPKSGAELRASLPGVGGETAHTVTTSETTRTVTASETANSERRFSNPVLSFVEKVVAPIPGVELGKLAKDEPGTVSTEPVRTSVADTRQPGSAFEPREPAHGAAMATTETAAAASGERVEPVGGETVTERSGAKVVRVDRTAEEPEPRTETDTTVERVAPLREERVTEPVSDDTVVTDQEPVGQKAVNPDEEATHDPVEGSEAPAATTEELTHPTPEYVEQLEEQHDVEPVDDGSADFPEPPSRDDIR